MRKRWARSLAGDGMTAGDRRRKEEKLKSSVAVATAAGGESYTRVHAPADQPAKSERRSAAIVAPVVEKAAGSTLDNANFSGMKTGKVAGMVSAYETSNASGRRSTAEDVRNFATTAATSHRFKGVFTPTALGVSASREPPAPNAAKDIVGKSNSAPASRLEAISTRVGWMATSPETSGHSSSPRDALGLIQSTTSASRNENGNILASAGGAGEGEAEGDTESPCTGANEGEGKGEGEVDSKEDLAVETALAAAAEVGNVTGADVETPAAAAAAGTVAVVMSDEDKTGILSAGEGETEGVTVDSRTGANEGEGGGEAGPTEDLLVETAAAAEVKIVTSAEIEMPAAATAAVATAVVMSDEDETERVSAGKGEAQENTESPCKDLNEVESEGEANSTEDLAVETVAAAEVGNLTGADVETPAAAVAVATAAAVVVLNEDKTELGNTNDADMETTVAATEVAVAVEGPSSDVDTVTHVEATATHSRTPSTSVMIQSANQGGAGQKEALGMTSAQSAAAVTIQSAQRGRAARIQAATMHAERSAAASHIQSALSRRAGRKRAAAIQADAPNSSPYTLHPIP